MADNFNNDSHWQCLDVISLQANIDAKCFVPMGNYKNLGENLAVPGDKTVSWWYVKQEIETYKQ